MTITRINEFHAQEGNGKALFDLVASFVPMIKSSRGCLSCQLFVDTDDADHIVVVEQWQTVADHQASAQNIPPETIQSAMQLMAGPPKGYYLQQE